MSPYTVICSTQSCRLLSKRCPEGSTRSEEYRYAARYGWAIVITGMETVVAFCPECRKILEPILRDRPDQQL